MTDRPNGLTGECLHDGRRLGRVLSECEIGNDLSLVAEAFPTARAVNAALRKVLEESPPRTRRTARRRNA